MIGIVIHDEAEVRVLQAIMSRPSLLAAVQDLAPEDFGRPANRYLWYAIRNSPLTTDPVKLACDCADWLITRAGYLVDNAYGWLAFELTATASTIPPGQRILDPRILSGRFQDGYESRLGDDLAVLKLARMAREQILEQQLDAARRHR